MKTMMIVLTAVLLTTGCLVHEDTEAATPDLPFVADDHDEALDRPNPSGPPKEDGEDASEEETPDESEEGPAEEPCEDESCEIRDESDILFERPFVSHASLPTSMLTNGQVTHGRIVVTAGPEDVALRQLTFQVRHSGFSPNLSSQIREVGTGTFLDRTEATHCYDAACTEYEVTLALREDVIIPAGTSKVFDIVTTVSGVCSGDWMETSFKTDGALVSACELEDDGFTFGIEGTTPHFIWTDIHGVHHSGKDVTPFGPMVLAAL